MFFTKGLKEWNSGGRGPEDTSEGGRTRPEDKPEVAASLLSRAVGMTAEWGTA